MYTLIKNSYLSLTRQEKKFLLLVSGSVLFLTLIPTIYALLVSGTDYFNGLSSRIGADRMVYLSEMEEARQGHFLFHNLYTSESSQAKIFSPVWLILGWLGGITTLSNLFIYHLSRLILGFIFLLLIYLFGAQLIKSVFWRKIAFFAIALGSGIGIFTINSPVTLSNMENTFGVDLWVSESNTFMTLYHSPLFILSQIMILLFFWWLIEKFNQAKWWQVLLAGLAVLFLGIFHPYDLVTIYSVGGIWLLISCLKQKKIIWQSFLKLATIYALSFPAILYILWLKANDLSFALWAEQNLTLSPRILNYISGYGLFFVFYLIGIYRAAKSQNKYWSFLAIWSVVGWLLLYVPLQFQRRLSNGLHLPIAFIAILGLVLFVDYFKKKNIYHKLFRYYAVRSFVIVLAVLILVSSSFYMLSEDLFMYQAKAYPYFISPDDYQAIIWLKSNLNQQNTVLGDPTTGNLIPTLTARKVYIGHGHQTGNFLEKLYKTRRWFFVTNNSDLGKSNWLKQQDIDYVYFGKVEDELGNFQPDQKNYLTKVFHNATVSIYKVAD